MNVAFTNILSGVDREKQRQVFILWSEEQSKLAIKAQHFINGVRENEYRKDQGQFEIL